MARCLVRGASLAAPPGEPPAVKPYREAAELLAGVLRDGPRDHPVRQAARDYLELVEHRTSPGELLLRAAAALTSRPPVDLDRAIGLWASARDACARAGTPPPALPAAAADLQRWLEIMTTKEGGAFGAALARHARDPSLPWLVAALVRAPAGDERVEALPAQAGRVPSDSPAAATLRWQRIRLRAWGIGELDAASREPLPRWAVNEVRARRSALASSIVDWGTTAPRLPTLRSEFGDPFLPVPGDAPKDEGLGDWTEAQTVNRRLELARLRELAATPSIPPLLARELRRAVWTRAVLLERWDDAAAAARELEGDLGRQARSALDAPDPLERGFRLARLGMSRHPRVDSGHPVR